MLLEQLHGPSTDQEVQKIHDRMRELGFITREERIHWLNSIKLVLTTKMDQHNEQYDSLRREYKNHIWDENVQITQPPDDWIEIKNREAGEMYVDYRMPKLAATIQRLIDLYNKNNAKYLLYVRASNDVIVDGFTGKDSQRK